ncbi:transglutaminase domain-containing protein [Streptococcus caprae]|uniref:Transglutaminase domain-containing protein n=1 Tax=Streptococcus caprae TaxID=1640501 RepID=A0ABV8CUQ2_9STRE
MKRLYLLLLIGLSSLCLEACQLTSTNNQPHDSATQAHLNLAERAEQLHVTNKFYYGQLNQAEKNVYLELKAGLDAYQDDITVSQLEGDRIWKVLQAISNDNPDIFWFNINETTISQAKSTDKWTVTLAVPGDVRAVQERIQQKAQQLLSELPEGSDYEKVKYLYDAIIAWTDYDVSVPFNQDIRSLLLYQKGVCAGYAKAFHYLAEQAGLESIYVTGKISGIEVENPYHAWNAVKIDGQYYWLDATWGDPVFSNPNEIAPIQQANYDYFCVPDSTMATTHLLDDEVREFYQTTDLDNYTWSLPTCTDDSFNYYKLKGSYFETYDFDEIQTYIINQLSTGAQGIDLQFANKEAFQTCYTAIEQGQLSQALANYYGQAVQVNSTYNPDCNRFSLVVTLG